jgi:TonB family protein
MAQLLSSKAEITPDVIVRYMLSSTTTPISSTGTVVVKFVVEKDGTLTNVQLLRDIGMGCGKEAVRMVKGMPKWIPGKNNGKAVRSIYTLPVNFDLK